MGLLRFLIVITIFMIFSNQAIAADDVVPKQVINVPINAINAGTLAKGRMEIRLHWKHISMDRLYEDNHRVDPYEVLAGGATKVPKRMDVDMGLLRIYYGLISNFRLCMAVPYIKKDLTSLTRTGETRSEVSGFGDMKLTGKYNFFNSDAGDQAAVHAGVKLPTGSTEEKDGNGNRLPPKMQLGSGSTDPFIGILYTKNHNPFWFHANLHYTVTTAGAGGYEYGDFLTLDLALQYQPHKTIVLNMEINGESAAQDKSQGVNVAGTGGRKVFISPGIQYKPFPGAALELSYQTPVWQELNGRQVAEGYRMLLGVKYNFNLL